MPSFEFDNSMTLITVIGYLALSWSLYKRIYHYDTNVPKVFWISLLTLCICAFYNDYWHYMEHIYIISKNKYETLGLEEVYLWLAQIVDYNYVLWRTLLWGVGVLSYYLIFRKHQLDYPHYLFIFIASYFWLFGYARSAVAVAVGLLGFSFLTLYNKKLDGFIGLLLLLLSIFGHKSQTIALLIIPFLFLKFDRKFFVVSLLFLPFAVQGVSFLFNNATMFDIAFASDFDYYDIESFQTDIDRRLEYSRMANAGIGRRIVEGLMDYSEYAIFFYCIIKLSIQNKIYESSPTLRCFYIYSYVLAYIALTVALSGYGSTTFSYRILNMAYPGAVLCLIFMLKEGVSDFKPIKILCFAYMASVFINQFIYNIYTMIFGRS